jgi:hypothetical protein
MHGLTSSPRRHYRLGTMSVYIGISMLLGSWLFLIVPRAAANSPNGQCCKEHAQKGATGSSGQCQQVQNNGLYSCAEMGQNKCTAGTFCGGYISGSCAGGNANQYCQTVNLSQQGYNYTWMCPSIDGNLGGSCTCVPNWQTTQCGGNIQYADCASGADDCS